MPENWLGMSDLQQRALVVAKRYVGAREDLGTNRGKTVALFQMFVGRWVLAQPWCAAFATFCIHRAAKELVETPRFPKSASSSEIYAWAKSHGQLLPAPVPGCVGLVPAPRGSGKTYSHTFLVHNLDGPEVVTIEGNLGNAVRWNRRRADGGYAWVKIV